MKRCAMNSIRLSLFLLLPSASALAADSADVVDTGAGVIGGAVLAIIGGFLIRSWLIGQMSNVHQESAAAAYLDRHSVNLTERQDTFLYTKEERRPRSRK